ncbi:MAG: hypothetical protein WC485_05765 [Opitutaceae bacterium]
MSSGLDPTFLADLKDLLQAYRTRCLWYLREDYVPATPAEILRVLDAVEARADRSGYVKARQLRQWLLRHSSAPSAAS